MATKTWGRSGSRIEGYHASHYVFWRKRMSCVKGWDEVRHLMQSEIVDEAESRSYLGSEMVLPAIRIRLTRVQPA